MKTISIFLLFLPITIALAGARVTLITAENSCTEPIWLAAVSSPGSPELLVASTGFVLFPTNVTIVSVPSNWSGDVWARTKCRFKRQHFFCDTGDCGSRAVACPRGTRVPPATTVAHFEADPLSEFYTFYVSETTGFNLAAVVVPKGGLGERCRGTGCVGLHPIKSCPEEVWVLDGDVEITGCDVAPNQSMGCFSANYYIQFCPPTSCKHDYPRGMAEGQKGNKGSALKIVGGILGSLVGILSAALWCIGKKYDNISIVCCLGRENQISANNNTGEVQQNK